MKQFISNSQRILLVCYVVFVVHTLAAPPEEVKNGFIAHRHRLREARHLAGAGPKFQSGTAIGLGKQSTPLPVQYTGNWAGAVQSLPPAGEFKSVTAHWIVPTASRPPSANGSGDWYLATWVGIDSSSCGSGVILQAGITSSVHVSSSGNVTTGAVAWYEWLPNGATLLGDFPVAPGDTVEVTIRVHSPSNGTARISNLSTKNSTTIGVSAPSNSTYLCGQQAEWVVEDFESGGLVPFAKFSTVYFKHCEATTTTGEKFNLYNSTLIDMVQNNTILATGVYKSPTELEVHYG